MIEVLADMDDFIPVDDVFDGAGILHISFDDAARGAHILRGFPFMLCDCGPEVKIEEDVTLIVHRRTQ